MDRSFCTLSLLPAGAPLRYLSVNLPFGAHLPSEPLKASTFVQRRRRTRMDKDDECVESLLMTPRTLSWLADITRRCSRRITLAFLPFEAKVNAA